MRRSSLSFAALFAGVALLAGLAGAAPEPWVHPDGSIHYYDAISSPAGINWYEAWYSAEGHGGYLATITSQAENNFIFGLLDSSRYWYRRPGTGKLAGPWLGGTQGFGSHEPDSGWQWVTSESMNYHNWTPGQPDNQGGNENALHFGESVGVRVPTWDDANGSDDSIRGFVRELSADSTTVGLRNWDSLAWKGYTLFSDAQGGNAYYLIDNKGRVVHSWHLTDKIAYGTSYLLENGLLSECSDLHNPYFGSGGRVNLIDWDGNKTWTFDYSDSTHCQHHDAIWLPNGHVVMIVYEQKSKAEAIAAGRDTAKLTKGRLVPDQITEVDPATDSIVWQWHVWDHLVQDYDSTKQNYGVVGDHPGLIDLNFLPEHMTRGPADWNHANALDYNADFDQIMISALCFSEVWVIDHSTTTAQAAGHTGGRYGHGGDLLYRWGNPQTYRAGDSTNEQLFSCHNCQWIRAGLRGAGDIMVLDNGETRPGSTLYSTIQEITPPVDSTGTYQEPAPGQPYGPSGPSWQYKAPPPASFYTPQLGCVQRLPNGNTLIVESVRGRIFEVGPDSAVVWTYKSPVVDTTLLYQGDTVPHSGPYSLKDWVYRSTRYAPDYAGLQGHDLTPGYPIELYTTKQYVGVKQAPPVGSVRVGLTVSPNPFGRLARISFNLPRTTAAKLGIYSVDGRLVRTLPASNGTVWNGADNTGKPVGRGVYYCRLQGPGLSASMKLVKAD